MGLVEFKKCAIFACIGLFIHLLLGLVEFKKCAILYPVCSGQTHSLGLVEFKKCSIFRCLPVRQLYFQQLIFQRQIGGGIGDFNDPVSH